MKYKVGDKVKLKSKQALEELERQFPGMKFKPEVYDLAGSERTICDISNSGYVFDVTLWCWSENMIEGLAEEQMNEGMETFYFVRQPDHMIECSDNFTGSEDVSVIKHKHKIFKTKEEALAYQRVLGIRTEMDNKTLNKWFAEEGMAEEYGYIKRSSPPKEKLAPDMQILEEAFSQASVMATGVVRPDGYIFKDENDNVINATKIVLEKKKKKYPKTYEECCKVLGYDDREVYCIFHTGADETLFEALYRLKVCRDAYWKIAGNWKPEYPFNIARYVITNSRGFVGKVLVYDAAKNYILEFPTAEMRDAFYENFKGLINACKELL